MRCTMAWELLQRFQYDLPALEYACRFLGETAPADPALRRLWCAGKARTAYLTGDLESAVRWQKQALPPGAKSDPMLEYFSGVARLRAKGR